MSASSSSHQGFSQLEWLHNLKRTAETTTPYLQSDKNPRVGPKWSNAYIYVYISLSSEMRQEMIRNSQAKSENNADKGASNTIARFFYVLPLCMYSNNRSCLKLASVRCRSCYSACTMYTTVSLFMRKKYLHRASSKFLLSITISSNHTRDLALL